MRAIIAVLLYVGLAAAIPANHHRIEGGLSSSIRGHPEMVALLYSSGSTGHRLTCGGVILNTRSIITAAHCTSTSLPVNWVGRVGSDSPHNGGEVYAASSIINHAEYDWRTFSNDIAIIRVTATISYSNRVQPARLAGSQFVIQENAVINVAGWGSTVLGGATQEDLRYASVTVLNQAECRNRYAELGQIITDDVFCSGQFDVNIGQCTGDAGGPVSQFGTLIGITSFVSLCSSARYPNVNTRIPNYWLWIQINM